MYLLLSDSWAACVPPRASTCEGQLADPSSVKWLCPCKCAKRKHKRENVTMRQQGNTLAVSPGGHHVRVPALTQLSRVQLACSFCSFQLKVVYEATLGKGTLKQLISVYNTWVITHTPEQRLLSCLDIFIAANRKKLARGASEKKCNFGAVIHRFKDRLSPLTTGEIMETKYST